MTAIVENPCKCIILTLRSCRQLL